MSYSAQTRFTPPRPLFTIAQMQEKLKAVEDLLRKLSAGSYAENVAGYPDGIRQLRVEMKDLDDMLAHGTQGLQKNQQISGRVADIQHTSARYGAMFGPARPPEQMPGNNPPT